MLKAAVSFQGTRMVPITSDFERFRVLLPLFISVMLMFEAFIFDTRSSMRSRVEPSRQLRRIMRFLVPYSFVKNISLPVKLP